MLNAVFTKTTNANTTQARARARSSRSTRSGCSQ
jgi:hypothetical protein